MAQSTGWKVCEVPDCPGFGTPHPPTPSPSSFMPSDIPREVQSSIGIALHWAKFDDRVRGYLLNRIEAGEVLPAEREES